MRGQQEQLRFHGGAIGALAPFALFLVGVVSLALSGAPDERGFWPVLLAALTLGLLLSRDRTAYAETAIRGMSHPVVMLMILAWMFAGILATLLNASGFVESLAWLAGSAGLSGGMYCVAAFLICCVVSTATGTSLGTIIVCGPLLYPAGGPLAAQPAVLLGAIVGGATFGDNVSPVSDTTIASAMTQRAEIGRVVRSRMRYALPAAAIAMVGYGLFGTGERSAVASSGIAGDPAALPMLVVPALVIVLLLRRRHLIEGLLLGVLAAIVLGVGLRLIDPAELFYVDPRQFGARGLIIAGIDRAVGISVFTLLLMPLVSALEASGLTGRLVETASRRARSARGAELWLVGTISLVALLITHSTAVILALAGFARTIGERFGIDRYRRANLLDVTVCTWPFLLPYMIPAILAASTTEGAAELGMPRLGALPAGLWNLHSWMLLVVLLFAVFTGWGRTREGSGPAPTL
jgi:Na+/H+ antiporter NhaC